MQAPGKSSLLRQLVRLDQTAPVTAPLLRTRRGPPGWVWLLVIAGLGIGAYFAYQAYDSAADEEEEEA